jgi:hypothetical protein
MKIWLKHSNKMQGIMEKHLELRDEKVAELVHIKD